MHTQVIILYLLATTGGIYFIFFRKVFDFVSIGFFGQLIYFTPGFYGYVANPYFPGTLPSVPIIDESYIVWNLCLAGTLTAGLFYRPHDARPPEIVTSTFFDVSLLSLIFISGLLAYAISGSEILSNDKNEVLENIDRIFLLFASACQVAAICFAIQRKWAKLILPALGLVFLLYVGFRGEFALSVIAIFAYMSRRYGIYIFLRPKVLSAALLAASILVAYKPFLTAYRIGNWRVLESLQMSDNFLDTMVLQFEPFLTQAVLNETLLRQFQVPTESLFNALVAFVPFLAPTIGLQPEDVSFNFHGTLFPNIVYGMTGSPQSQFIAAMGWFGIVIFIFTQNILLVITSKGMLSTKPTIALFALGAGAFFSFYVQRNDLANSLTLVNRVLVTIVFAWLGAWLLSAGGRREKFSNGRDVLESVMQRANR